MDNSTTKTCTKCCLTLPATHEFFYKNGADGKLKAACKSCVSAINRAYDRANLELVNQRKREWESKNQERNQEHKRRWRKNNPEKVAEISRKYDSKNRQKNTERYRQWKNKNREKVREMARVSDNLRRSRTLNLPSAFTRKDWMICLDHFNYCCAVCGRQLRDLFGVIEPHQDHWIPLSNADCPGTIPQNMICLCNGCNLSKHDKLPEQWLTEKYGTKRASQIMVRVKAYFEGL